MRKVIFLALSLVLLLLLIPAGCLVRRSSGTAESVGLLREADRGGVVRILTAEDNTGNGSFGGLL